jgi:hypothetical protein
MCQSEQQQRLSEQEINRRTGAQLAAGFEHTKEKKWGSSCSVQQGNEDTKQQGLKRKQATAARTNEAVKKSKQ